MFDDPYELEAPDGARLTVRSAAARALILEVRLPLRRRRRGSRRSRGYGKRFDVLRGALLVDGEVVHTGERMIIAGDRELDAHRGPRRKRRTSSAT